jgi:hypothetical protein
MGHNGMSSGMIRILARILNNVRFVRSYHAMTGWGVPGFLTLG